MEKAIKKLNVEIEILKKIGSDMPRVKEQIESYQKAVTYLTRALANDQTSEKDLRVCEVIASAWVSVKERLPNHRQKVLFCTRTDVHKALYMEKMSNEHGDFNKVFLSTDGGHYELEMQIVTHWMPLPIAPN